MDNMLLIDGNSLINRAFYALPPLTNAKGEPTQAVYGFTTMLIKAIEDYKPKYIAVAFDLKAPTFRHLKYDGYKATRKGMPEELAVQLPILKELLKLMNISIVEKQGFEADDIIGTLAADDSVMTYIITGDRDSLQLIGKTTRVVLTKRGITDTVVLDEAKLMEDFALTPRQVIDYKSLAGDSSDNIPGVPGVGDKTALNLISRYSDLGGVYSHIDEIGGKLGERLRAGEQSALLSYELATIKTDVPLEEKTSDFIFDFPFSAPVRTFFADNGFKSLLKRDDIFAAGSEKAAVVKMTAVSEKRIESLEFLSELFSEAASFAVAFCDDIRISTDGAAEYVIPLNRSLVDTGFEYGAVIRALKPYLENSELKKYVFDGKRVKKTLKSEGTGLSGYDDVKLLQYLADMRVGGDSLTELLETLGYDKDKPAAALFLLGEELKREIKKLGMEELYLKAELPLVDVLFDMEERGVQVDVKLLNKLGDKFISEADQLSKVIFELAGKRFNINSPRQLASVLFDDLKIPYPKKSAKHSTNAEILEMITEEHEIVPLVSKYRFIAKLNSTYIEGIRRLLTPDNIIHTDYKQMLTTTGRLSSAEPNLQNIPVREVMAVTSSGSEVPKATIVRPIKRSLSPA